MHARTYIYMCIYIYNYIDAVDIVSEFIIDAARLTLVLKQLMTGGRDIQIYCYYTFRGGDVRARASRSLLYIRTRLKICSNAREDCLFCSGLYFFFLKSARVSGKLYVLKLTVFGVYFGFVVVIEYRLFSYLSQNLHSLRFYFYLLLL